MRRIATIFFCILCCLSATRAQDAAGKQKKERTISLWGHVKDSFTKAGIVGSCITLMTPDSVVVDSMQAFNMGNYAATKVDVGYRFHIPAREAKYIIRAEHPDYETTYVDYEVRHIARNTYFDAPWHLMKRKPLQGLDGEHELGEVVVKATRVKMVYKGDTIVYNADAFNLPEGSMLDALIRQMDGVELKDDGRILVNGEQIDELTLNGKDFFKGNNRVMLDNLPHYTVDNVQVYHKTTDKSAYLGRDIEQKKYVMDVILKREYAEGFMANAEVAGGSHDRYLARLFGLRYTDHSRLSAYGNTNNVNENRRPGSNGEWTPANMPQGRYDTRQAGVDLLVDQADKRWKENMAVQAQWRKAHTESLTASENFLANSGSTFSRNLTDSRTRNLRMEARNTFTLSKPFYMLAFAEANYQRSDGLSEQTSVLADSNPESWGNVRQLLDSAFSSSLSPELQRILVNRNRNRAETDGHRYYTGAYVETTYKMPSGDEVGLIVNAGYENEKATNETLRQIDYLKQGGSSSLPAGMTSRLTRQPHYEYQYNFRPSYVVKWLNGIRLGTEYRFQQRLTSRTNEAWLGTSSPSVELSEWWLMGGEADLFNSYHRLHMAREHRLSLNSSYQLERDGCYVNLTLSLNGRYLRERLHHRLPDTFEAGEFRVDTLLRQNTFTFSPELRGTLAFNNWMRQLNFFYTVEMLPADLTRKVDVRNDENPLSVQVGNPHLKGVTNHRMQVGYNQRWKQHQQSLSIGYGLRFFVDQVSQGYTYDPATGVYTYRPENVSGNWQTYFWNSFGRTLDKQDRLSLNNYIHGDYSRNVDVASASSAFSQPGQPSDHDDSQLSHVNNWYIEDRLTLSYRLKDLTLGAQGYVEYRHANSVEHTFDDINALNFSYGLTCNYNFKAASWPRAIRGFSVATDLKMFSRRGYGDASLNQDDLVWNASISRTLANPFGKKAGGSLTMRLEGFDLLSQLTNTSIVINGQGRAVAVSNTLPRYVMLHLTYNFSRMPKKR